MQSLCFLDMIYSKIYFNLWPKFALGYLECHQIRVFRLEQKSLLKFLMAENYKQCEIFQYDVNGDVLVINTDK